MSTYKFKDGFEVVYSSNSKINNDNLTDELALHLLAKGTVKESDFENFKQETITNIKTTKKTK
jgi:hypothetical protein